MGEFEVAHMIKTLCIASAELKIDLENTDDHQDMDAIRASMAELDCKAQVTSDIVPHMKSLWNNKGIQQTLHQRHKFQIPDHVAYWFDSRLDDIYLSDYYLPTFADYLRLRIRSTGFIKKRFIQ
eukprot:TRINITY_DN10567_c0_g1_i1.p1 TRINITY_DN10567_c0_g1~~TRINITY_DN10567_c0_g1_i1.p1  ORF type:complete len:139 (-),score=27.92 TRINITY_DN10567_c0_g1_i1:59-430(-)